MISARSGRLVGSVTIGTALLSGHTPLREQLVIHQPPSKPAHHGLAGEQHSQSSAQNHWIAIAPSPSVLAESETSQADDRPAFQSATAPPLVARPFIASPDKNSAAEAALIAPASPPSTMAENLPEGRSQAPLATPFAPPAEPEESFADISLLSPSTPFLEAFGGKAGDLTQIDRATKVDEAKPAPQFFPEAAGLADRENDTTLLTMAEPAALPLTQVRAPSAGGSSIVPALAGDDETPLLLPVESSPAALVPEASAPMLEAAPSSAPLAVSPPGAELAAPPEASASLTMQTQPASAAPVTPALASLAIAQETPIAPSAALVATPLPRAASPTPQTASPAPGSEPRPSLSSAIGRLVFPAGESQSTITDDDELILQIRVRGITATDTIIAYGTREGVFLPLGELARILDLAIRVSDEGHYASGWFLSEDRTLTIDLRQGEIIGPGGTTALDARIAQAFDGEMYLRAEAFAAIFPMEIVPDLRTQAVLITTLEPFPFEERMRRDAERARLAGRAGQTGSEAWPRQETPWLPLSYPMADVELRALSDVAKGARSEVDLRLAGDLAWMTAQTYLSATTRDGLVAALVELGRRDADGDLLGPLRATEFQLGDVGTRAMPLGLRGASGRGAFLTNQSISSESVFDRVDLRGVLPDGYEVELYRNDVLLDSTRTAVNGQYEFLQVPLDYGINVIRLVFYGPQGQRREDVRQIAVGDGRLSPGRLEYAFGAVQRGVNLLGIEGPDFRPPDRYGDRQITGELAYGLNRAITAVVSGALFEEGGQEKWLATAGLRSGIGPFALRADAGVSSDGGKAFSLGLGGRALGGSFTVSHFEYSGNFIDELRNTGSAVLRRATELDFNTSLPLGATVIPLSLRARNVEFRDGRSQLAAGLRGSLRLPGMIASNTLELLRTSTSFGPGFSQLVGNFDLATFNRSRTQMRASLGYRLHPDPALTVVGAEVDHAITDGMVARGFASYSLLDDNLSFGASAIREFEKFTLALDGQYALRDKAYSLALRLGFSFGRDPIRGRMFVDRPGLASSGAAAVRAFHDLDGDRVLSRGDLPLQDVDFAVFNLTDTTDQDGVARLTGLGNGNRVSVQVDPSTLPDILMAPVSRGIEIVPRAGRFHTADFAVMNLGEIEGTVSFANDAGARGVSGLRIGFQNESGIVEEWLRTERGGYYFYERAKPGRYKIILDPEQAERLGICLSGPAEIVLDPSGEIVRKDIAVSSC